jgi:hypothetical protein
VPVQLLWFTSVIGSVACAAAVAGKRRSVGVVLAGFLVGAYLFRDGRVPEPGFVGVIAAVAAGLQLFRPAYTDVGAACAGILAATSGAVLESFGAATPIAWIATVAPALLALVWSHRNPKFAPAAMREEALLMVMLLGLGTAVVPEVVDGWRSASALSSAPSEAAGRAMPAWVLLISGTAALLGGVWSLWRHR